jgi:uncharacterized phage protein gp47/JayE
MEVNMRRNRALSALLLIGSVALAGTAHAAGQETGVVTKVERAVEHGVAAAASGVQRAASAAARGVERGAKAAASGVERGVKAAASGVERGAKATARAARTVAGKVGGEAASAPAK